MSFCWLGFGVRLQFNRSLNTYYARVVVYPYPLEANFRYLIPQLYYEHGTIIQAIRKGPTVSQARMAAAQIV